MQLHVPNDSAQITQLGDHYQIAASELNGKIYTTRNVCYSACEHYDGLHWVRVCGIMVLRILLKHPDTMPYAFTQKVGVV